VVLRLPLAPLSLLFFLSATLLLGTVVLTLYVGGTSRVKRWLQTLLVADAAWALTSVVPLEARSESVAFVATGGWVAASSAAGLLWFLFAVVYTGRDSLLSPRLMAALAAPLVVHVVAFVTNPLHGVSVRGFSAGMEGATTVVEFSYGPVYSVATGYALLLVVAGTVLVAETALRDPELYADQSFALVVGSAMPIAGVVLTLSGVTLPGVEAVGQTSYTPATLSITAVCYGYALLRTDLLTTGPIVASAGRKVAADSLNEGFLIVDGLGQIVEANAAARELLSARTLVGSDVSAVVPADGSAVLDTVRERTIRLDDGTILAARATKLTDGGNSDAGRAVMLRDVTERRRREERLQVLNRVLRHNLRNDLNTVRGFAAMIADDEVGETSEAEVASRIVDRANDLLAVAEKARTVEQLLDAETTVEREPVALAELADDLAREVARGADRDVGLVVDTPESCRVQSNKAVVEMMLEELLDNAVRHSDREEPTVRLSVTVDDRVRLCVADDGPGIPEDDREAVLSGDETRLNHGSRFGLWTVRWGVRYLGGEFTIRDRSPTGTVVEVSLPRVASAPASSTPETEPALDAPGNDTDPTSGTADTVSTATDAGENGDRPSTRTVATERTPSAEDGSETSEPAEFEGVPARSLDGPETATGSPVEESGEDPE